MAKKPGLLVWGFAALLVAVLTPAAQSQEKNKIGLVLGATITPSRELGSGLAHNVSFGSSLALGAEYDRRLLGSSKAVVYGQAIFSLLLWM